MIVELTFKPVTVQQWNSALFSFQQQTTSRRAAIQRAAQIYQVQQATTRRREQLTRDFIEAERTVRAAVPACLKWEKNVTDAHEATSKAQEEYDTAKQQAEEAQTAANHKQDELNQTQHSRTPEENRTAFEALKHQYEEVKAMFTAAARSQAVSAAKQAEGTAQYKYETDVSILTRCLTTVTSARLEMRRLGSTSSAFNVLTGALARVSARASTAYEQASDTSNVKGELSKGSFTIVLTVDGQYLAVYLKDKHIGWIHKSDVEFP